jgi:hypothetical protein
MTTIPILLPSTDSNTVYSYDSSSTLATNPVSLRYNHDNSVQGSAASLPFEKAMQVTRAPHKLTYTDVEGSFTGFGVVRIEWTPIHPPDEHWFSISSVHHPYVKQRALSTSALALISDYLRLADELSSAKTAHAETPTEDYSPIVRTLHRLDELRKLEDNWNGYNVSAPQHEAIAFAKQWVEKTYLILPKLWTIPHVTANEDGEVVLEWSKGKKRLLVYISDQDAGYIMAWGPSITSEMTDGEAMSEQSRGQILAWLLDA